MTRVNELQIVSSATFNSAFIITHSGASTPVFANEQILTRRISYPSLLQQIRDEVVPSNQPLYSYSNVVWNTSSATNSISKYLDTYQSISIGGTSSTLTNYSLFIDNTIAPLETAIGIKGYSANYPSTISNETIPNSPTIIGSYSNLSQGVKFAVADSDKLFVIGSGGYSGNTWHTPTGELSFYAQGTWQDNGLSGNANTATNVGTGLVFKTYPPNTLRHTASGSTINNIKSHFIQGWTTENNIPLADILVGSGIGNDSSAIISRNDGTVYTSFGATKFTFVNSRVRVDGVSRESLSNYDNLSLLDSNTITIIGNRGGAASGRRNSLAAGDTLGRLEFRGQTGNSATISSLGGLGGEISFKALENFSSLVHGTKLVVTTANTGTNTTSTRLDLHNKEHIHYSDVHTFRATDGTLLAKLTTSSFDVSVTATFVASGLALRQTLTTVTNSVGVGSSAYLTLSAYKSYMLSKIQTSVPSWVRIYTDATSRANDVARSEYDDPVPGLGIIVEVITTAGSLTQLISPGALGFNNDSPVSNNMYLSVTNKSGASSTISVALTLLQLEG